MKQSFQIIYLINFRYYPTLKHYCLFLLAYTPANPATANIRSRIYGTTFVLSPVLAAVAVVVVVASVDVVAVVVVVVVEALSLYASA